MAHFAGRLPSGWTRIAAPIGAGIAVFALSYSLLSSAAASPSAVTPGEPDTPAAQATPGRPLSQRLPAGHVAIQLPAAASQIVLSDLKPGSRMDVFAEPPGPRDTRTPPGLAAQGATLLAQSEGALLLDVSADEGMILAHLVQSGSRFLFLPWPPGVTTPPDPADVRTRLGSLVPPTPQPAPAPGQPAQQ